MPLLRLPDIDSSKQIWLSTANINNHFLNNINAFL